jgi:membrane associated rhomboid family serine protease
VKREILYTHHPFIFRRESVFPIEDQEIRGAGRGLFNWALIIINVLVIVFMITLNQEAQRDFINQYGVIPAEILQGIEAVIGHIGYLVFYLLGGLAASAARIALNAASNVPSVGASGAVAAVLGAYIVMFPESKVKALVLSGA